MINTFKLDFISSIYRSALFDEVIHEIHCIIIMLLKNIFYIEKQFFVVYCYFNLFILTKHNGLFNAYLTGKTPVSLNI